MAQARRQLREKRGGGLVRPAADLADPGPDDEDDILARAVGSEPTPEFAAMVAEEYRRLLERLDDDVLRKVAMLRMEGHTSDEIAEQARLRPPHRRPPTGTDQAHPGRRFRLIPGTLSGLVDMSLWSGVLSGPWSVVSGSAVGRQSDARIAKPTVQMNGSVDG